MFNPDWIVPDWPAPANARAVITTRAGGVSAGPYASFNLGYSTGDDTQAVRANRERLRAMLPAEPRWLKQVHGARVVEAESVADGPQADASTAREPGTVCAIMVADCLPILLTDADGSVVAAAHAGWRGLAAGVIDNTIAAMVERGADGRSLMAYIGPGIGPTAFEVGDDVLEAYTAKDAGAKSAFRPHAQGKWLADLPSLARRTLERCGVARVYGGDLCTYDNAQRFYSYRRDRITGRMGAFIWRV
ncbi:MAG TPA: peptidoglycan editing factor PgeF [Burkholderiales bacterium]|nr:peptidoglycan editing factor PgeF [Burkholderiales bacterium]